VEAGFTVVGETDYYGVPCVEIVLPVDRAIYQICRQVPSLNAVFFQAREAIAIINGLNMFYPRGRDGRPYQTEREKILIPLDTTIQPRAFPEFDEELEQYPQFILVDRDKQLLAYYEKGLLVACFPVSTGRRETKTPPMEGWVSLRDKDHISSKYEVLMPFSLCLSPPYYLHAGVMTGLPDSHGCIRLFMEQAEWLFRRVGDRKTRFKII
jgi:lipoprotein-anchoring transpeptidase ErfK/SrfK